MTMFDPIHHHLVQLATCSFDNNAAKVEATIPFAARSIATALYALQPAFLPKPLPARGKRKSLLLLIDLLFFIFHTFFFHPTSTKVNVHLAFYFWHSSSFLTTYHAYAMIKQTNCTILLASHVLTPKTDDVFPNPRPCKCHVHTTKLTTQK